MGALQDTLAHTPELVEWAAKHIDIVQVMVFILFRAAVPELPFEWYAGGRRIDLGVLAYSETKARKVDLKSTEVVAEIRKRFPEFTPCAYLNGTEKPDSFKWLLSGRQGSPGKIYGYVGSRFMETIQTMHHLSRSRYFTCTTNRGTPTWAGRCCCSR